MERRDGDRESGHEKSVRSDDSGAEEDAVLTNAEESIRRVDLDLLPWGSFGIIVAREFKALLLSDEGFKQAEARREDKIPEKFEIDNYDESSDINVIYLTQSLFFPTGKNGWVRIDEDVTKEQLVNLAAKQGYDKYRGIVFVSSSKTDIAGRDAIDINRNIYYYDLYPYLK